ncbi:BatA domain-containing protein [Verrucomicrobiaceae bacterium N1E253]|uniref:BatA domain-containing protein n=1 Tax=Oceaniferula marina TaxID=2748318 RepID=A0A851GN64_9BACT|nr:BatA domain-containing protein [Oceaniferula marina]
MCAIPVVILIHFLQRQAKVQTVSTLFLLQRTQKESSSGRRFDRLIQSIPLWLQILAVLLITWILAQPRYVKAQSTQRIAIVLDSSASMQVCHHKLTETIRQEITRLRGHAGNIDVWLMESAPEKESIHRGSHIDPLLASLNDWRPTSGATDPSHSLRIARSLVGQEGAVSYITDTPLKRPLPFNSSCLAIGTPIGNYGFTGVSFTQDQEQLIWKAVIRNYTDTAQTCQWWLESATGTSEKQSLQLDAKAVFTLQGAFPAGQERCRLMLSPDEFTPDNQLPMVRPQSKQLLVHSELPTSHAILKKKILTSFPRLQAEPNTDNSDLVLTTSSTTPLRHHLIFFLTDVASKRPYLTGPIVATKHPLTEGLNWQTLIARNSLTLPHQTSDEVLLWQGSRPLIYLRTHPQSGKKALFFNFDIQQSNALKQESIAVLLLRFCEQLRKEKIAPESRMSETGEPLELSYHTPLSSHPLRYEQLNLDGSVLHSNEVRPPLQAPDEPGFFHILQAEKPLLSSATYFADTREADFSACGSDRQWASNSASAIDRHTRDDHYWRLWAVIALLCILGAWFYTHNKDREKE